jgi:ribosomal protein L7/L12
MQTRAVSSNRTIMAYPARPGKYFLERDSDVDWGNARKKKRDAMSKSEIFSPEFTAELLELMRQGRKIDAIKLWREKTNVGLKEAKEAVEAIERGQTPTIAGPDDGPKAAPDPERLTNEVMALLREGETLAAIKRWREVTGADLKAAKDAIDLLRGPSSVAAKAGTPAPPVAAGREERELEKADFEDDILSILQTGSRKEAIHRYIALTGETEDRARNAVDHLAMTHGIQKKGRCFIATACYGSYDAPEVVTLRRFRDERLAPSPAGAALVRLYYLLSPPLARAIADRPQWRRMVRRHVLAPLVGMVRREHDDK